MTENNHVEKKIIIRSLKVPEDGLALAKLFNAFNDSWEMGFQGSGNNTPEMALEIALSSQRIDTFVAEEISESNEKRLVGYCSLHPHRRDPDALYVGILGVHPEVLGKKVGKKLMLKSVQKTADEYKRRIDLGTWAGNLNAMPLYKKVGLFWEPDTSVHMEGFIPLILNELVFSNFWKKHPDWYSIFKREITQAQDDEKLEGVQVYTYKFKSGEDSLTVWIDRYAKDILGFDMQLDGKTVSLKVKSTTNTAYRGIPFPFNVDFESNSKISKFVIESDLPDGINTNQDIVIPESLNGKISTNGIIDVDVNTKLYREPNKGLAPKFNIKWGNNSDQQLTVSLGLKVQSAIEIKLRESAKVLYKTNQKKKIDIILNNNMENKIEGKILVSSKENNISESEIPIILESKSEKMVSLNIDNLSNGIIQFDNKIEYNMYTKEEMSKKYSTEIFNFEVPILSLSKDHIIYNKREKKLEIYNGFQHYTVHLKGSRVDSYYLDTPANSLAQNQTLGPPYGFDEMPNLYFSWSTELVGSKRKVFLTAKSEKRTGLVFTKILSYNLNDFSLSISFEVENTQKENSFSLSVRSNYQSLSNPSPDSFVVPFKGEYIEAECISIPRSEADFGIDPSNFHESWIANISNKNIGQVFGVIWNPNDISEIRIKKFPFLSLDFPFNVNPGEKKKITEMQLYSGHGSWKTILSNYERIYKPEILKDFRQYETKDYLRLNIKECKQEAKNNYKIKLHVKTPLLHSLPGNIVFNPDKKLISISPEKITFDCNSTKQHEEIITLEVNTKSDIIEFDVPIEIQTAEFSKSRKIKITLPLKDKNIFEIIEEDRENFKGFKLSHPLFEAFSAPKYTAGLVSLLHKGKIEILHSSFPNIQPSFLYARETGGIRFSFSKNLNDVITGKDLLEYEASIFTEKNYKGLVFTPIDKEKLFKIAKVWPEYKILMAEEKNEIIFRFTYKNLSKAPQKLETLLEFLPKLHEDFSFTMNKGKEEIVSIPQQHQFIAMAPDKINNKVLLESPQNNLKIAIYTPNELLNLPMFFDIRPVKCYMLYMNIVELDVDEVKSYEYKLKFLS